MILDGKHASKKLLDRLVQHAHFDSKPTLAAIQVGNNPASSTYIAIKKRRLEHYGLGFQHIVVPEDTTSQNITFVIDSLNADKRIDGIILQLPLPQHLNPSQLLEKIAPEKDCDCLTSYNLGKFFAGYSDFMPATPLGVIRLLDFYGIDIAGKNICVIGRSNLVGKPLGVALLRKNATVTLCHSQTKNLTHVTRSSDIVISAVGMPEFLTSSYFTSGQTVVDIGTSKNSTGMLVGDVQYADVVSVVENITPVPGGVGPMTIYGLIENLVTLKKASN